MSAGAHESVETLVAEGPVALRDIEGALLALRCSVPCSLDETQQGDPVPDQPITRACMSNLIVYCDDMAEADGLHDELARLGHVHPARMIVLVADAENRPEHTLAQLRAGLSDHALRRQVSSEQIRIDVPADDPNRAASAARPLLIGDLPSALWWNAPTPPPMAGPMASELMKMTSSLVYDSRGWRDPARGLVSIANWVLESETPPLVADLAWMRQRGWRRLFAETLAPHLLPGALGRIDSLRLEHGPHALPLVALFLGWFASSLEWAVDRASAASDSALDIHFTSAHGPVHVEVLRRTSGAAELQVAHIATFAGADPIEIQFDALSEERIAVRIGDGAHAENIVHLPSEPRMASLAWQLANRSGDTGFHAALACTRSVAKALAP